MSTLAINKTNFRNNIANFVIGCYFVLVITGQFFSGEPLTLVMSVLGFFALVWQVPYILKSQRKLLVVFFLFSFYSVVCVFIFQGRTSLTALRLFVHFVFFILLVRYEIKPELIRFLLICYSTYICIAIFYFGINPNTIFADSSKNFVGWIGLAMGILYYALLYKNRQKMEVFTAAVILLLAIACVGRSTIVSAILLFTTVFITSYRTFGLATKILSISLLTGVVMFLLSGYYEIIEFAFSQFEKKGFESAAREDMLYGYLDKLNVVTFFFGVTLQQYPFTFLNANGNVHNSFLAGHSLFGAFAVLFFIYLIYVFLNQGANKFFLKALLAIILMRSLTDTLLFVSFFDFIVFYIVYLLANKSSGPVNMYSSKPLAI